MAGDRWLEHGGGRRSLDFGDRGLPRVSQRSQGVSTDHGMVGARVRGVLWESGFDEGLSVQQRVARRISAKGSRPSVSGYCSKGVEQGRGDVKSSRVGQRVDGVGKRKRGKIKGKKKKKKKRLLSDSQAQISHSLSSSADAYLSTTRFSTTFNLSRNLTSSIYYVRLMRGYARKCPPL